MEEKSLSEFKSGAETPAPAVSTAEFVPEGTACPACGVSAHRLWDEDGTRVCQSCKDW